MEEKKTQIMTFRLTPSSRANIDKVCAALGMNASEFLREFVVRIANEIGGKDNE